MDTVLIQTTCTQTSKHTDYTEATLVTKLIEATDDFDKISESVKLFETNITIDNNSGFQAIGDEILEYQTYEHPNFRKIADKHQIATGDIHWAYYEQVESIASYPTDQLMLITSSSFISDGDISEPVTLTSNH